MIEYQNKVTCQPIQYKRRGVIKSLINNKVASQRAKYKGRGVINSLINKLPIEFHLPGYQYCGPGTKLQDRLARGDPGINKLDEACKEHDIAYSKYKDIKDRHIADRILAGKAWERVKSRDASLGERTNAWFVTNAMNAKVKFGMGIGNKTKSRKIKKKPKSKRNNVSKNLSTFRNAVREARYALQIKKPESIKDAIKTALVVAKSMIKNKKKSVTIPRIVPVPKVGGVIPFLIPLFAGLSAAGAIAGGASGIAKAVNAANDAKKELAEAKRHNETMEAIAMGRGLYLKPYKKGLGLYLKPELKNY